MKHVQAFSLTLAAICALSVSMCDFPYEPQPAVPPAGGEGAAIEVGRLVPINSTRQICNASVSPAAAGEPFAYAMLWLNFNGPLNVDNSQHPGFTLNAPYQHDRLTITDTANSVVWYMMSEELGIPAGAQIQDPQWSTHPDYLVCVGSVGDRAMAIWNGYVVRLSDREVFRFNNEGLFATSTPHLWVGGPSDPPPSDVRGYDDNGNVSAAELYEYFGTLNVKIAFTKKIGGAQSSRADAFYVDYSTGRAVETRLAKPAEWTNNMLENVLISPDGGWLTYYCFQVLSYNESYVQRLAPQSQPIKLVDGNAAEPYWWPEPGSDRLFIIYATAGGPVQGDFATVTDGSLGVTRMQQVAINTAAAAEFLRFRIIGEPVTIIPLPFRGGLSPDGKVAVTGYEDAWVLIFN